MKHLSKLALLAAAFFTGLSANAQSINAFGGQSVTISSDQTCTSFDVLDGSTLTVNQGVTLTLNMNDGHSFILFDNSNLELHGTLAGSVGSGATWMDNTYINVYLSDGAKYTVTGLECMDGYGYLCYYGYDAATDGHGTVSVTNGSTAVTASSIGYSSTTYTFTATPSSGYRFVNWTKGAGGEELGTDASINVTCEQNGQYQVYANFEEDAPASAGYTVSLKDGTQDAKNWTITSGEKSAKGDAADGLTGLSEKDAVTLTYTGRLKVKGVTATSDEKPAAPSVTEVTTFSELQAVLSAGKDVKLMNDIVCTAEINITSDGALTIDGNGKTLSTTSAIRAFKVESSATVAFKNLTITGFVNGGGPAINNSGTTVLDGCTISNCHVNNSNGGGAIESTGKLYAVNTIFSGNYSGEIGGAINNFDGSLYMSGCTFTNNYTTSSNAFYGGAIGINGGSEVRLINCTFSGNKYGTNAGTNDIGVYWKPGNYTIAGCIGATIAPRADVGDITTNTTGTATLDYSDLSNISFTYTAE